MVVFDARRKAGPHHHGGAVEESCDFNQPFEHLDLGTFFLVNVHGETRPADRDHRGRRSHAEGRRITEPLLNLRVDLSH